MSDDSSLLTGETDSNAGSFRRSNAFSSGEAGRQAGLINLSFEGNTFLGDLGAAAISELISTQNAFSNNLRVVNLNECGITNSGFESLRQSLRLRASLASRLNLTHVKITIERNNINQEQDE